MIEVMLRPNWPGVFRRTVASGKASKVLVFAPNQAMELQPDEVAALGSDFGRVVFPIERDEKNRPRFVEVDDELRALLTEQPEQKPKK